MEMEMEMETETCEGDENVIRIEIPSDEPINNYSVVVKEWENCIRGHEMTHRYHRKRVIEKVPPLLLKGGRNNSDYQPAVVSLGPYHHNQLPHTYEAAEAYKSITLQEYCLSCGRSVNSLYNKVFEVVNDARACYVDCSTDKYNDQKFNRMMLRDGCFILFFIECISQGDRKVLLNDEYLGALGFGNVVRDIFMLENQVPFVVLEFLLGLRFPKDKGEEILHQFFNYLNYGEVITRDEKVLEGKKPLHLLELYRSYFISLAASLGLGLGSTEFPDENFNYVNRNRSFASVMNLKAKGIFLKRTDDESSNEDIKFHSRHFYGELEIVRRAVSLSTKAIYLNMIAYEMCPHNPNDFRISTYIRVMKSLVTKADDVKELRIKNIMLHSFGQDEEVVKMFDEIEVPTVNLYMFDQLRRGIEKHCNSSCRVLIIELLTELRDSYFSSPWKTVALLLASAIMFSGFIQTYFTIYPRR